MNSLDQPGPRWFTIPAHRPFLDDLAAGLIDALPGPEDTPGALLLVPTRRAVRALAESFLKAGTGQAVLLPQIRALGDLDEGEPPFEPGDAALDLPPAIDPLRRRFELAALAARFDDQDRSAQHALSLADALAQLIDSAAIEEAPVLEKLDGLVELDLAEHWEKSARLLEQALVAWPERLLQLGLMDVAERQVVLLDRLAEQWTAHPPLGPVIAAGSTGSAPASARLLKVIAGLPRGAVILPGLDQELADSAWAGIEDQHPQDGMRRLLLNAGVPRGAVREWRPQADRPGSWAGRWRRRLVNEALRPADATADWLRVIAKLREEAEPGLDPFAAGLDGLTDITAASEDEAATVCALLLREALETPDATAALVTPDQALARRVSARLARWGVAADSTAGTALTRFPAGMLAQALAGLIADPADPVARLAVLKNPLVRLNRAPEDLAAALAGLERWGLRGPRPRTPEAPERRLDGAHDSAGDLTPALALSRDLDAAIGLAVAPFTPDRDASAREAAAALTEALEKLCEGAGLLWAGPEGECLSRLLAGIIAHGEALPALGAGAWNQLVQTLLGEETVRGAEAAHPRLQILGVLESRMIRADRLILAGLEEGVWPRGAVIDPFLSRPMRKRLGLPSPERKIGQSAHDFAQAACAPAVTLVSSARREGAPATPSRWLWRLRTLAAGAGAAGAEYRLPGRPELLEWARLLDRPGDYRPVPRPRPVPPVGDRPRKLSVTRIEALTRDPYAVWARDILKLFPLDRPDQMVEAMARGTAIHSAFEQLALKWNQGEPPAPEAAFETYYLDALAEQGLSEAALARERALAREAAKWVAGFERRRRADGARVLVEASGEIELMVDGVRHVLTAKADRIEVTRDRQGHILDYKTGSIPTKKMVDAGFSPQLTLTAAILRGGGFKGVSATPGELTYVRVTGRNPAGAEEVSKAAGPDSEAAADAALEGTRDLLRAYLSPGMGYPSRIAPQFVKTYAGDYDHLARVFEWSTGGDGEEGGE